MTSTIKQYLEAADRRPAVDVTELGYAARNAAHEVRELVRAASVLYQCMGVLAEDHPKRELLLDTLAWMQGTRDEKPDFDALLPFDVEARA